MHSQLPPITYDYYVHQFDPFSIGRRSKEEGETQDAEDKSLPEKDRQRSSSGTAASFASGPEVIARYKSLRAEGKPEVLEAFRENEKRWDRSVLIPSFLDGSSISSPIAEPFPHCRHRQLGSEYTPVNLHLLEPSSSGSDIEDLAARVSVNLTAAPISQDDHCNPVCMLTCQEDECEDAANVPDGVNDEEEGDEEEGEIPDEQPEDHFESRPVRIGSSA